MQNNQKRRKSRARRLRGRLLGVARGERRVAAGGGRVVRGRRAAPAAERRQQGVDLGKEERSHLGYSAPVFYAILVILHPYFRRDARSASSSVPFARKSRKITIFREKS